MHGALEEARVRRAPPRRTLDHVADYRAGLGAQANADAVPMIPGAAATLGLARAGCPSG
jgi:hypothetical protein